MTAASVHLPRPVSPESTQKSKSSPSPALFSTVLLMAALCIGVLMRSTGSSFLRECFRPASLLEWSGIFALVAGLFGAIALHEAGHLLAALLSDFEVSSVVIGPFRIMRVGTSWTIALKKHRLFEASVSAFPRTEKHWRRRMMAVIAAGPLATLMTGLAAALLLYTLGGGDGWLVTLLRAFLQVSFFIFILGLVPNSQSSPCQNDAALFCTIWRNSSQADEIFLYHRVLQQGRVGTRPRDYPLSLIRLLADFNGRADFSAFFATTVASWAFDSGRDDEGNAWDRKAVSLCAQCGSYSRTLCAVNSACFDMLYRRNSVDAAAKLSRLDLNAIVPLHLQYRAKAAAHLAAGQAPEALATIATARFTLPKRLQESGFEYLMLSGLHAKALRTQPETLSLKVQKQRAASLGQTSPAAI